MRAVLIAGFMLAITCAWTPAQDAPADQNLTPEVVNEKPKPTVAFARSWEAAVEEARLLNVPIVVHSHGFY